MRHGSVCRQLTLERDDDTGHSQRFSTDFWLWREPRTCSRALLPFLVAEPLLCFQPHAWAFLANLLTVECTCWRCGGGISDFRTSATSLCQRDTDRIGDIGKRISLILTCLRGSALGSRVGSGSSQRCPDSSNIRSHWHHYVYGIPDPPIPPLANVRSGVRLGYPETALSLA